MVGFGGGGGGGAGVRMDETKNWGRGSGWMKRRIKVFVKIQKKNFGEQGGGSGVGLGGSG